MIRLNFFISQAEYIINDMKYPHSIKGCNENSKLLPDFFSKNNFISKDETKAIISEEYVHIYPLKKPMSAVIFISYSEKTGLQEDFSAILFITTTTAVPRISPSILRVIIAKNCSLNATASIIVNITLSAAAYISIISGIVFFLTDINADAESSARNIIRLHEIVTNEECIIEKNEEITEIIIKVITIWLGS